MGTWSLGETHDPGCHLDRVVQSQLVQTDRVGDTGLGEQPFGALDQMRMMPIGDHGGREEAGHLGALLVVQGTVRDEDRMMLKAPLRDELGGESRLGRRVPGSEDLPGGRQRTNPPDLPLPLDPGLGRLAGPDRPALAHLIGHHCILPQTAKGDARTSPATAR